MDNQPVIIIGAGIAGLTCGVYLARAKQPFVILEASEAVGGRVQTDNYKGYLLDRGFQVFIKSYPEAQKVLNLDELNLQYFRSGARIWQDGKFVNFLNPLKEPEHLLNPVFSKLGTFSDKLKLGRLVLHVLNASDNILFSQPGKTTRQYLQEYGFSAGIIHNFFEPFFGGVFLDRSLQTNSNFFRFVFKYFISSDVTVPANGMGTIPGQIHNMLPPGSVKFQHFVSKITPDLKVHLSSGEVLQAGKIVLATNATAAAKLLNEPAPTYFNQTTCTYFSADIAPDETTLLLLNVGNASVVHNVCVPSNVAPNYAPPGKVLISVSTHGPHGLTAEKLAEKIRGELLNWFGLQVRSWEYLKTYFIPEALPPVAAQAGKIVSSEVAPGTYKIGDYTNYPSLNAAMETGRKVAEEITGQNF